jgi:hypothetical protein
VLLQKIGLKDRDKFTAATEGLKGLLSCVFDTKQIKVSSDRLLFLKIKPPIPSNFYAVC